jgi:hypothetical protein
VRHACIVHHSVTAANTERTTETKIMMAAAKVESLLE